MLLNENNRPILQNIIELDVTVASGTNIYGSGNKYIINGETSPSLNFIVGNTYVFDLSGVDQIMHPFAISAVEDGKRAAISIHKDLSKK